MTTAPAHNFAQRLRLTLAEQGLENKQLASMVGVSANSVSNWTTGRYKPGHRHAEGIAVALGMTMDELHGRTPRSPPGPASSSTAPPTKPKRAPSDSTSVEGPAERIVQQLAALDLDATLQGMQQITPSLMDILREARRHASRQTDSARPGRAES